MDAPDEQPETKPVAPKAQAPEVTMGVSTINDHEKRIFALEQHIIVLMKSMAALEVRNLVLEKKAK